MKKLFLILLALTIVFGLCACGTKESSDKETTLEDQAAAAIKLELNKLKYRSNIDISFVYSVTVTSLKRDLQDNAYTAYVKCKYQNSYNDTVTKTFTSKLTHNPSAGNFTVNELGFK